MTKWRRIDEAGSSQPRQEAACWRCSSSRSCAGKNTLKDAFAKSAFKGYKDAWHLNVLRARQVNRDNAIASWKEDIFFRTRV